MISRLAGRNCLRSRRYFSTLPSVTKTILCYGDNNTWGFDPASPQNEPPRRFPKQDRWPGVLEHLLQPPNTHPKLQFNVIEEALNGRTTTLDDPLLPYSGNGKDYLSPCLHSHDPIDLVILALGCNDLKHRFALTPGDICTSLGLLIDRITTTPTGPNWTAPKILLIPPPLLRLTATSEEWGFKGAEEKSIALNKLIPKLARQKMTALLDIELEASWDGVHLDKHTHHRLGTAITGLVLGKQPQPIPRSQINTTETEPRRVPQASFRQPQAQPQAQAQAQAQAPPSSKAATGYETPPSSTTNTPSSTQTRTSIPTPNTETSSPRKQSSATSSQRSVPFMITADMRERLSMLGYVVDDIKKLTPVQANQILSRGMSKDRLLQLLAKREAGPQA